MFANIIHLVSPLTNNWLLYIEENVVIPIAIDIIAAGSALFAYCVPNIDINGTDNAAIMNAAGIPMNDTYLVYNFDISRNESSFFNEYRVDKFGVSAVANEFGA